MRCDRGRFEMTSGTWRDDFSVNIEVIDEHLTLNGLRILWDANHK